MKRTVYICTPCVVTRLIIPVDLKQAVEDEARRLGMSFSQLVNSGLDFMLDAERIDDKAARKGKRVQHG